MESYDVIIIGAGPAGLTAGLYSIRNGLKTAVISKDIGGTANSILSLENWPGYSGNGAVLMKQFYDQLKKYEGIKIMTKDVESVKQDPKTKEFLIRTKKDEFSCKALILATGTERRKMKIPGEQELTGRGVSYCVTCDAFFFKGKTVAVIGGSDCAATSALALTDLAKKVYVIYRGEKLRCEELTTDRLEDKKNAELVYNAIPTKINGKEKVESIEINQKGKKQEIKVDGIFVEVGSTPLTNFLKELNVKMDKEGYIIVDEEMSTSVKGIFAAGDITHHKLKQVVVASGQGAIAAKSAYEYLKEKINL